MKTLISIAIVVFLALQYQLWFGESGYFKAQRLVQEVSLQSERVAMLTQSNKLLTAEVLALKESSEALEARARQDLGLVKADEVFYLVADDD